MARRKQQKEFEFTLLLDGPGRITRKVEDALFRAGCDDATISIRSGRMRLTFSRSAPSLKDAILSAIRDVRASGIGATVVRVDQCDLVTQSEIARRIGRSRQLVHQYITGQRGPGGFPPPVGDLSEGAPLWHWCDVARWLWQNNLLAEEELRNAQDVAVINSILELQRQERMAPKHTGEIKEALSAH